MACGLSTRWRPPERGAGARLPDDPFLERSRAKLTQNFDIQHLTSISGSESLTKGIAMRDLISHRTWPDRLSSDDRGVLGWAPWHSGRGGAGSSPAATS